MSYSVVRRSTSSETAAATPEAAAAVRLLRDWAAAYPEQRLDIRDASGSTIAFRSGAPAFHMAPPAAPVAVLS